MNKSWIKIGSLALCCILSLSGCGKQQNKENVEKEKHFYTLEEVRSQMDETMEKAYSGAYKNLEVSHLIPVCTQEDSVSEMQQQKTEYGDLNKTMEECVKEQYELICNWLGVEEVDKTKVIDYKSEESLDKVEKMFQDGTYPEDKNTTEIGAGQPALVYKDKKGVYFLLTSGWCDYMARVNDKWNQDYTVVKEYYADLDDESLQDSYKLEDGECTVAEAIAFAEEFQNEKRLIPHGKDFEIKVERVRACEFADGTYGFDISMHRVYKGVAFVGLYQGSSIQNQKLEYDMGAFSMTNRKLPDICEDNSGNETMTVNGNTYTEIISLDRVFQIVSEKLGKNAKCKVVAARLSYKKGKSEREFSENGYVDTCQLEPVWYVELVNETDGRKTRLFIGVQDYNGENITKDSVQ